MNNISLRDIMKLLKTVDEGLCYGVGEPQPGQMCVQAAVCYALGMPHGDDPECVGATVRRFMIALNDSNWSSSEARAKGLRKLAVAQLGSDQLDQARFAELIATRTVQRMCPPLFAELAKLLKTNEDRKDMESVGRACAEAKSLKEAVTALVGDFNPSIGRAAIYALDLDLANAVEVAYNIKHTFPPGLSIIPNHLLSITIDRALVLSVAIARVFVSDEALVELADTCLEVLIEMESPGCQWLGL